MVSLAAREPLLEPSMPHKRPARKNRQSPSMVFRLSPVILVATGIQSPTPSFSPQRESGSPTPSFSPQRESGSPTPSFSPQRESGSPTPSFSSQRESGSPTPSFSSQRESGSPTPSFSSQRESGSPTPSFSPQRESRAPPRYSRRSGNPEPHPVILVATGIQSPCCVQ